VIVAPVLDVEVPTVLCCACAALSDAWLVDAAAVLAEELQVDVSPVRA
jgi:hypothetical protein